MRTPSCDYAILEGGRRAVTGLQKYQRVCAVVPDRPEVAAGDDGSQG